MRNLSNLKNFFTILIMITLLGACNNTENPIESTIDNLGISSTEEYIVTASDFAFIGEAHNAGLNFVYYDFIDTLTSLPMQTDYKSVSSIRSCYFVNNIYTPTSTILDIDYAVLQNNIDTTFSQFTDAQKGVISRTIDLFRNNSLEISDLQNALDEMDIYIQQNINPDERIILWSFISVARSSLNYWSGSDANKWIEKMTFLNEPSPIVHNKGVGTGTIQLFGLSREEIAGVALADAVGFVSAVKANAGAIAIDAVRGAIVGGLETGGLGAVPGAIIGAVGSSLKYGIAGAVSSSATSLAVTLASHWF